MQGRHLALPENRRNWTGLHLALIYQILNERMKENLYKTTPWICSEVLQGQAYMHMQCRHGPFINKNIYAMSPSVPCAPNLICNVAPCHLRSDKGMQCRHVTSAISIGRNQSPLRSERNLKIMIFSSYLLCSVAMRYLL